MVAHSAPNTYSPQWFAAFHTPIRDARTRAEVEFICSVAPLPDFRRIADVCCGMGRHARALAERGYSVTAIDRDSMILERARRLGGAPHYLERDLRDYSPERGEYDAVVIMGQSFGHFDAAGNETVLGRLASGLRHHGRLILDLWATEFFHAHPGEREFQVPDGTVHEVKQKRIVCSCSSLIQPGNKRISSGSCSRPTPSMLLRGASDYIASYLAQISIARYRLALPSLAFNLFLSEYDTKT